MFRSQLMTAAALAGAAWRPGVYLSPDPEPTAGGGGTSPPPPPPPPAATPEPKAVKSEVEFKTKKEYDDAVAAAVKASKDAADAVAAQEDAKKKGEFQKLYDTEKTQHEQIKLELRNERAQNEMRRYALKNHAEVADKVDEWVWPKVVAQLKADTKDEDVTKLIKDQVKAYAEAHKPTGGGTPSRFVGGKNESKTGGKGEGENTPARPAYASSM